MATLIYNVTDLQNMQNDLAGDYELANDIDASATATWNWNAERGVYEGFEPIGTAAYASQFTGSLDGRGYKISGLYSNRAATVALFAHADGATIANLTLENIDFISTGEHPHGASGLVHFAEWGMGVTVDAVHVSGQVTATRNAAGLGGWVVDSVITNCSSSVTVTGTLGAGGLLYYVCDSTIEDSHSTGNVEAPDAGGFARVIWTGVTVARCYATGDVTTEYGGGFAQDVRGTVTDSYATGDVIGGASGYVAGFTSQLDGRAERCFATGDVSGEYANGFVNDVGSTGVIEDCYARGNAYGIESASGFADWVHADGFVRRSYSTGAVTGGSSDIGGFIAYEWGGTPTIEDCFWDTQTSGQATSAGGTGKTTAEMKQILTFSAWDIATSPVARNDGYPFLSWEIGSSPVWLITSAAIPDVPDSPRRTVDVEDIITLQAIRNLQMSALGEFYIDEEGYVVYSSRYGRNP